MYDYRDIWLKKYQGELKDYKKILDTIPTDESEELERTILNPANEREISLCAVCLSFFDNATKTFKTITEEMNQSNECEYVIGVWEESIDGVLYHHRYEFETKKKYYTTMLEMRPELADKLSRWIKEELTRVLSEPAIDEEYRLCQEYLGYLADEVEFKDLKDKYLDRLVHREETLSELKEDEATKGALEILLDPRTEKELDFCTAYFGFQDDIKHLKENINQGNIQVPSVDEESAIIDPVACVVKALHKREPIQGKLDFFINASPEENAEMLYRLNCLEYSDIDGLIKSILDKTADKFGNTELSTVPYNPFPRYYETYSAYKTLSTWMHNYHIYRIDRNNSTYSINRFMRMAEVFHGYYTNAAYSADTPKTTSIKQKEKVKQKTKQELVSSITENEKSRELI